ncbi:integrase catalytic domain-containing protein [Trichonephila inaurata madagascariensis]|uniref:Integrase catalytic domain-containing protein n=1 Tax=Trichonephila inaurata madagascariensis TaxID=2747483 RepID=A0A8X6XU49_9ARAC|nr:integrase catalytic domain-containing protein [Trichonephila inaurata madagascariensis]
MAKGCFNLRGWESNVPDLYFSRSSGVTSLLGLLWDLDKDTLKCNLNYSQKGPSWLLEPRSNWPIDRMACKTSEVEREKRKVRLCNLVAVEGEIPWYAIKFSNFQSIIRFVSWMLRIVKNVAIPVSLPSDRVNDAVVFEVVGVDLAGPLYLKGGHKSWIVLFTCATYRAIHLELTSSLTSEAFLLSLRRFIARRGRPRVIYSDNGTNFSEAQGELGGIDWEKNLETNYHTTHNSEI